ncbi:tellurite resistance protein TerC [Candidatus Planktophila dulcis]|uniref:TerC family protein n=1 Tax=Candidatus Planktophila dulcis TaxID=1884914 RepID=UPI000BACC1F8|nr:TerC family protein [Candidatus Planktophila dulcis]ASY14284.1 tellurite resistance protein TerC [Candidatus Planktophila dulcis]
MNVSLTVWSVTIGVIALLLIIDLFTVSAKPHEVKFKEAASWSIFYIGIAVAFGIWVFQRYGSVSGTEFFAAYLVEKSLSVDNLFVFVIILAQFAVPSIYHQRVLLIGVMLALVLRGIFISVGAAALAAFSFTFVIFGAILIWTGVGLFSHWDEDPEPGDNAVVKRLRKRITMVDEFHGTKLFIRQNGKRVATPMFLVMIAIGSTDLLFALDSIPATFGVTSETFLVFAANAFALLGLRALYFLVKGLLDRLVYLSLGLSIILMFIGIKLILTYLHEEFTSIPKISTPLGLAVIGIILVTSTIASLVKTKSDPTAKAHAGRVIGSKDDEGKNS